MPLGLAKAERKLISIQNQVNEQWATGTIASSDNNQFWYALLTNSNMWKSKHLKKKKNQPFRHIYSMNVYCLHVIIDCLTQNNLKKKKTKELAELEEWKEFATRREKLSKMKLGHTKNEESVVNASILHERNRRWLCRIIYSEFNGIPLSQWIPWATSSINDMLSGFSVLFVDHSLVNFPNDHNNRPIKIITFQFCMWLGHINCELSLPINKNLKYQ